MLEVGYNKIKYPTCLKRFFRSVGYKIRPTHFVSPFSRLVGRRKNVCGRDGRETCMKKFVFLFLLLFAVIGAANIVTQGVTTLGSGISSSAVIRNSGLPQGPGDSDPAALDRSYCSSRREAFLREYARQGERMRKMDEDQARMAAAREAAMAKRQFK